MAVDMVSKVVVPTHMCAPTVDAIRRFLVYNWQLSFLHTLREGNKSANSLVKMGAFKNLLWFI